MRIVSHQEQHRYLSVANPLVHDVAVLIVETGMRPEEVFRLKAEHLHLPQRYLKVTNGKTCFSRRNILLTESARGVLKRRLAIPKGRICFRTGRTWNGPLNNIDRGHHKAVRDAGIVPGFRLYDFRHTFGSRSAMAGVDLASLEGTHGAFEHYHDDALRASHTGAQAQQ